LQLVLAGVFSPVASVSFPGSRINFLKGVALGITSVAAVVWIAALVRLQAGNKTA
jgi:hypothetical protein